MPVRTPALCRRSVPQPAQTALASHGGIWITDSMLRRDLERYHRRFLAPGRCLGSHAGPLESRRRLGKRHMAGLMPSTPVYPPLWHFHVASTPGAWQWEAPNTHDERRRKEKSLSLPALFDRFIRWLEKSDADRPFIEPPPLEENHIGLTQAVVGKVIAGGGAVREGVSSKVGMGEDACVVPPIPEAYGYPADFPKEVVKLRSRIMLLDEMTDDALHRICKTCRRSLQRRIVDRRQLSAEGLKFALEPFDEVVLSRIKESHVAGKFAAMIRRTVLSAMIDAQRADPAAPLGPLWLAFADWICASGGGHSNTQLFWRLMQGIPEEARDRIPSDQLFELTRSFITDQAYRHNIVWHWVARAQNFSEIYGSLSSSQRERLRADVLAFLASGASDADVSDKEMTNRRMRIAWLVVEAHDKGTTDEALALSHDDLIRRPGLPRLNEVQIWQLMAGRAQAHGGISKGALSKIMEEAEAAAEENNGSTSQRWAALIRAVLGYSATGPSVLQAMCRCLTDLGKMDVAAKALLSVSTRDIPLDCVRALATASNDHRFALRLHDVIERRHVSKPLLRKHFTWEVWAPYVERMIGDDAATTSTTPASAVQQGLTRISQLLDLTRLVHKRDPEMLAKEVAAKVELLDQMGHWYMQHARHRLSDRQLLRRISECAAIQRQLIRGLSADTMANLARVIVKDLDEGKWGRTTRLEWLVRLVAQVRGDEEARRVASVLKGWRSVINETRA